MHSSMDLTTVEALSLREALSWVKAMGISNFTFEMDARIARMLSMDHHEVVEIPSSKRDLESAVAESALTITAVAESGQKRPPRGISLTPPQSHTVLLWSNLAQEPVCTPQSQDRKHLSDAKHLQLGLHWLFYTSDSKESKEFSSKNSISDYKLWLHSDIHGIGRFSAPYNHHPLYHSQTQTPSTVPDTNGRFPEVFKLREGKTEDVIVSADEKSKFLDPERPELKKIVDFYVSYAADVYVPTSSNLFSDNVVARRIATGKTQVLFLCRPTDLHFQQRTMFLPTYQRRNIGHTHAFVDKSQITNHKSS
nr:protein MANNAN SYNTHESIS-RELATED 1-like [Ipomoea batatas]